MPTRTKKKNGKRESSDLPSTIASSDKHAQDLFKKARASARKTYGSGEREYRVAYAALKHEYKKQGDRWVKKAKKGPSDPQAARGPTTKIKSTDKPRAPTARGKVAKTASEARRKARQAQREYAQNRRKKR
ncbi:MAG: ChaB family protein [Rudaea sp.]